MKTQNSIRRLLYASNVSNVSHLEYLIDNSRWEVFILRPWVPGKWIVKLAKSISRKLFRTLSAREGDRVSTINYVPLRLGVRQFYAPLKNFIANASMSAKEAEFVNKSLTNRVAKNIPKVDVVIATRDIFPRVPKMSGKIYLAEMRELHPINHWNREATIAWYPYSREKKQEAIYNYLNKFENIRADASGLITYSNIAKDSFVANGYPAEKIFVVPLKYPAIDSSNFQMSKTNQCLFVGRDDPNKGLDLAVIASLRMKASLKVVGHYSVEVINWMKSFKHVEYVGPVSRNLVKELMISSHALLAPSIESYGLAVIEALESGCLIVSSKLNGAAATFSENLNVFCSDNLDLDDFTFQLSKALSSNYKFSEKIQVKNITDQFNKYILSL